MSGPPLLLPPLSEQEVLYWKNNYFRNLIPNQNLPTQYSKRNTIIGACSKFGTGPIDGAPLLVEFVNIHKGSYIIH